MHLVLQGLVGLLFRTKFHDRGIRVRIAKTGISSDEFGDVNAFLETTRRISNPWTYPENYTDYSVLFLMI